VYLLRVADTPTPETFPNAKMPTVLLPAAEPLRDAAVAAPPALTTSPEYVYLLRVTVGAEQALYPNAKMPTVLLPAAEPRPEQTVAAVALLMTSLEYVYLLRLVVKRPELCRTPQANIPAVGVPAAAPYRVAQFEVPAATTHPA
jgi:hypothetical protein